MTAKRKLDQALQRAERRDRKRRTPMKVSGKSVLTLSRLLSNKSK